MTNNKNAIDMKTIYFSSKKSSIYSVLGLFALVLTSCGSYQNKSYYDNDGVYGSEAKKTAANEDQKDNAKYKEYFSSLNKENQEVFTDVENYTSNDSINKNSENQSNSYNSWGSNSNETVVVNVYDNSWGWNYWNNYWYGNYWGWNNWGWNGYYGNNWGWNNYWYGPNWGWGWNGYYGNPYWCGNGYPNGYYYGNHYAYVNGRRDVRTAYPVGRSVSVNRSSNSK